MTVKDAAARAVALLALAWAAVDTARSAYQLQAQGEQVSRWLAMVIGMYAGAAIGTMIRRPHVVLVCAGGAAVSVVLTTWRVSVSFLPEASLLLLAALIGARWRSVWAAVSNVRSILLGATGVCLVNWVWFVRMNETHSYPSGGGYSVYADPGPFVKTGALVFLALTTTVVVSETWRILLADE